MWRIAALDRDGREVGHFDLAQGELSIGRDTDRQLILPSASVSRRHARVILNGGQPTIVDDGSSNGVHVDGVRIASPTLVGPMSRIDISEFRITVVNLAQPAVAAAAAPAAAGETLRLCAEGGPYDGRVFDVPAVATVGRALENELVFDDPSLSRKHARLTREGGGRLTVEDLGSSNGTYVNGRKVGKGAAGAGETIQFGDLLFRIEGELSGTRSVEATPRGQVIALAAGGAVAGLLMLVAVITLFKKPPVVQASGREAIAKITQKAEQHLVEGRNYYRERKYSDAKAELDAALDADPANLEARKLSRLAAHGPDDERALAAAQPQLGLGDRRAMETALRWYADMTDGSTQKQQLQGKLVPSLERLAFASCGRHVWPDCAWAACRAYEVAAPDASPDAKLARSLADAEKHLSHDKTYLPCRAAPAR